MVDVSQWRNFINVPLESKYIVVDVKSLSGILPKKIKIHLGKIKIILGNLNKSNGKKNYGRQIV